MKKPTLEMIYKAVCEYFKIKNHSQIFSSSRKQNIVYARQIFMYLAYNETRYGVTLLDISKFIFNISGLTFNHATIIHNKKKIKEILDLKKTNLYKKVNQDVEIIRSLYDYEIRFSSLIPKDVDLLELSKNYSKTI